MALQQVTENVFADTRVKGCNFGYLTTSDGVVLIDTPMIFSAAKRHQEHVAGVGDVRYLVITEPHLDHWATSALWDTTLVTHWKTREAILEADLPHLREEAQKSDAESAKLVEGYELRSPDITFDRGLTLHVGDHTVEVITMAGHTPHEATIVLKEERVAFTSDNVFHRVQTWLPEADLDAWHATLETIRALDVDIIVPGHGDVTDKSCLDEQGAFLDEWKAYAQDAIDRGLTKDEVQALPGLIDKYPMDVELDAVAPMVMRNNLGRLYDLLAPASEKTPVGVG
jgi:glyoxylase-like metal-dependent hydrolase (beta-lactamase superfamily II)